MGWGWGGGEASEVVTAGSGAPALGKTPSQQAADTVAQGSRHTGGRLGGSSTGGSPAGGSGGPASEVAGRQAGRQPPAPR